jgi:hypothetical protein
MEKSFDYRVIRKQGQVAIHEVYYDEKGEPTTCTEDPVAPVLQTVEAFERSFSGC